MESTSPCNLLICFWFKWHVKIYNSFKMTVSFLFILANSTVTALLCPCWWFSFSPGGVVPSACWCWVPAIASRPAYMGALTQHWPAMVVLAKCQRSIQMLAFYSKVGAQLKVTKVTKNGQSISLQPGVTSKSGKIKKCLEFSSDSRLFTFGISQALSRYEYREQQYAQTYVYYKSKQWPVQWYGAHTTIGLRLIYSSKRTGVI